MTLFILILFFGLILSVFTETPILFIPVVESFVIWTPLGFLLTAVALVKGIRKRMSPTPDYSE